MKKDARLAEFVANPTLKRQLKKDALGAVAKKLSLSETTGNLLRKLHPTFSRDVYAIMCLCLIELMAENGRLNKLETVIGHFKTMMATYRGEVPCEVTSAKVNFI